MRDKARPEAGALEDPATRVSRALVRILADMVEAALTKRGGQQPAHGIQSPARSRMTRP